MKTTKYTIKSLWDILKIVNQLGYNEDYKGNDRTFRIWKPETPSHRRYHVRSDMIKKMGDGIPYEFRDHKITNEYQLSDMFCINDSFFYCSWMLDEPDFFKEDEFIL